MKSWLVLLCNGFQDGTQVTGGSLENLLVTRQEKERQFFHGALTKHVRPLEMMEHASAEPFARCDGGTSICLQCTQSRSEAHLVELHRAVRAVSGRCSHPGKAPEPESLIWRLLILRRERGHVCDVPHVPHLLGTELISRSWQVERSWFRSDSTYATSTYWAL